MQFTVPILVTAVLALGPAVAAVVPESYETGVSSRTGSATISSGGYQTATGTRKWHHSYSTSRPLGTAGNGSGTMSHSMTKSSKHGYTPTVTYSQSSRVTSKPKSSKTHSKTQSGKGPKPTDCKKSGGGLSGLSKTQQILLSDT